MEKQIKARIQHKIDIQENWEKATNFIPLKGEWIFYDKDANNENIRLKIGDGTTPINDLEFVSLPSNIDEISWNDLTDKPFYETGWSIEWDGTPTEEFVDVSDTMGAIIYKVGEEKTKEELIGTTCKYIFPDTNEEKEFIIESSQINDTDSPNCFVIFDSQFGIFAVALEAGIYNFMGISFEFSSAGTWFVKANNYYYPTYVGNLTVKQIDPKFIPNYFGEVGTKIEWDGTPTSIYESFTMGTDTGYFYKVAEPIDTIIDGTAHVIQMDGDAEQTLSSDMVQVTDGGENGIYIMNVKVPNSVFAHPAGVDITFREVGLYFFYANVDGQEVKITSFTHSDYKIKQIDEKYIPDIYLKSAAAGAPNGIATLDDAGKVPLAQLPDDIGGGLTEVAWKDIQNKPFGESGLRFVQDDLFSATVTVSGNVDGVDITWYKVAEPYSGSLNNAKLKFVGEGEIVIGADSDFILEELASGSSYIAYVLNIVEDNETISFEDLGLPELTISQKGLYIFDPTPIGVSLEYFQTPDYEIIKIDEKFLPDSFGGVEDCPTYTGGQIMGDLNNLIVINYYKLLTSMTADYKFDMDEALYDINSEHFTITFYSFSNITSNNAITIKIASGYTGSADSMDLNSFTSNISVELVDTKELKSKSWYTAYCLYNEASNKWSGYLISAASDTSSLENKINNLESRIGNVQSQVYDKQDVSNLVTDITNISTDAQYPSAKLLYDTKVALETSITNAVSTKQDISNLVTSINSYSGDYQYPSAKLLYDIKTNYDNILQFDTAPTANSEKLLKSGAIATALNKKADTTTLNTQVNNLTTEINKKATQTALDTAVSDLTTEIGKKANSESVYTKSEIDGLITGVFYYKGSVDTFAELPATAKVGDTYNVKNADAANNVKAGDNVVWCEIDGVGYWDVLSGIVDLSAYETAEEIQDKLDAKADLSVVNEKADKTDLNNYLTSEEVQTELNKKADLSVVNEKADKSDLNNYLTGEEIQNKLDIIDTTIQNKVNKEDLEQKINKSELSQVALSNDYFDLNNKPCYYTGVNQEVIWDTSMRDNYHISVDARKNNTGTWSTYTFYKADNLDTNFTLEDYKNSFVTYTASSESLVQDAEWVQVDSAYILKSNSDLLIILIPENNLSMILPLLNEKVVFEEAGIYFYYDDFFSYINYACFKRQYTTLDENYLPIATTMTIGGVKVGANLSVSDDGTISATSLDWNNVEGKPELYTKSEVYNKNEIDISLDTKVDKVTGSRLMTNDEGTKLSGIEENANNYTLPAATTSSLGGVKVGDNLSVAADGTISATSLDWNNINNKPELYNKSEIDSSLDEKQDKSNLVTDMSLSSTDEQYPSAKLLYNTKTNLQTQINERQLISNLVTSVDENSTDTQYPSAKLLYDIIGDCDVVLNEINTLIGE